MIRTNRRVVMKNNMQPSVMGKNVEVKQKARNTESVSRNHYKGSKTEQTVSTSFSEEAIYNLKPLPPTISTNSKAQHHRRSSGEQINCEIINNNNINLTILQPLWLQMCCPLRKRLVDPLERRNYRPPTCSKYIQEADRKGNLFWKSSLSNWEEGNIGYWNVATLFTFIQCLQANCKIMTN